MEKELNNINHTLKEILVELRRFNKNHTETISAQDVGDRIKRTLEENMKGGSYDKDRTCQ